MANIIDEYNRNKTHYERCTHDIESLIIKLIEDSRVTVLTITSRVKSENSITNKISNNPEKYRSINDITDIIGIRIITFFEEDVEIISKVIQQEFKIDTENSIDKGATLAADRFGYRSVHFIALLADTRNKLIEYQQYTDIRFEIQIRSILQHAWAEIEHDLGYKSESGIPDKLRRKFTRAAGLLELVDEEFNSIRQSVNDYKIYLEDSIKTKANEIAIDAQSIEEFVRSSQIVDRIDRRIAVSLKSDLSSASINNHTVRCKLLHIPTIGTLERLLIENESAIEEFSVKWVGGSKKLRNVSKGISIFYLGYVLVSRTHDIDKITEYIKELRIGGSERLKEVSDKILQTSTQISR